MTIITRDGIDKVSLANTVAGQLFSFLMLMMLCSTTTTGTIRGAGKLTHG